MGRFKAVSKAWCLFIESLNLPPFFLGLFFWTYVMYPDCNNRAAYSYGDPHKEIFRYVVGGGDTRGRGKGKGIDNSSSSIIDPALSFLPFSPIRVIDSCNGLLLLLCRPRYPDYTYYICNPLTKSWTQLLDLDHEFSRLEFDPMISRNFKIVTFVRTNKFVLNIRVLSADTPMMTWKHYYPFKYRELSDDGRYRMMSMDQHHALWKGSLYLLFGRSGYYFGDAGRIMRLDLLEDHVADRQLIELPKGTNKPQIVGIGKVRNKLCFAGLDWINNDSNNKKVLRMRVWSISKRDQTIWVLEHDSFITSYLLPPPLEEDATPLTYIGQFHPFLDVVFILFRNMVYAYNLKNLSLNEVCLIASNYWRIVLASIYPFSPSSVDYSTQWTTEHRYPCFIPGDFKEAHGFQDHFQEEQILEL